MSIKYNKQSAEVKNKDNMNVQKLSYQLLLGCNTTKHPPRTQCLCLSTHNKMVLKLGSTKWTQTVGGNISVCKLFLTPMIAIFSPLEEYHLQFGLCQWIHTVKINQYFLNQLIDYLKLSVILHDRSTKLKEMILASSYSLVSKNYYRIPRPHQQQS